MTEGPPPRTSITAIQWSLAAMLLLVTLPFLNSRGTNDVAFWVQWGERVDTMGLRGAYAANGYYPPLATVLCWLALHAGGWLGFDPSTSIRLAIAAFHVVSSLIVLRWTRNLPAALAFYAALLLNTVAQGYIDIFAALPLLLALWALDERRLAAFALLFAVSALIKWQALIIAPFLAIHVIATTRRADGWIDVRALLVRAILPALALVAVALLYFGWTPTLGAFTVSVSHDALSGEALNLGWIATHLLLVFDPRFGGLVQGRAHWIDEVPAWVTTPLRATFFTAFAWTLWAHVRRNKTFEALLTMALLGFLAYFILNTGVHENHLFIPAVLAILLAWRKRDALWPAVVIVVMSNINLLLFGGLDGHGPPFSRVLAARYDTALPLAVANVVFFCWFWSSEVLLPPP